MPDAAALSESIVKLTRLKSELEPCVNLAAARAAAREVAETRRWFEERALPKAVRVAQREIYDLLRKLGTPGGRQGHAWADPGVGVAATDSVAPAAKRFTPSEITEVARTCVAILEALGKAIDETLHEIRFEAGGWLLPEDAPRVRAEAERVLRATVDGGRIQCRTRTRTDMSGSKFTGGRPENIITAPGAAPNLCARPTSGADS